MSLDISDVVSSLVVDNLKTTAGAPSQAQASLSQRMANVHALAAENAVAAQQMMHGVNMALATAAARLIIEMDPSEALSVVKANTGNDPAQQLATMLAALNSGQQGVKSAQTTPPVTP